jgi:hypothetical protein
VIWFLLHPVLQETVHPSTPLAQLGRTLARLLSDDMYCMVAGGGEVRSQGISREAFGYAAKQFQIQKALQAIIHVCPTKKRKQLTLYVITHVRYL